LSIFATDFHKTLYIEPGGSAGGRAIGHLARMARIIRGLFEGMAGVQSANRQSPKAGLPNHIGRRVA
jgi:hypothetical protein